MAGLERGDGGSELGVEVGDLAFRGCVVVEL
jgi:hypothetical protein